MPRNSGIPVLQGREEVNENTITTRFLTADDVDHLWAANPRPTTIDAAELDPTPRTLVYGYTLNRETFHLYLGFDSRIHRVIYNSWNDRVQVLHHDDYDAVPIEHAAPSKRSYPECCDLQFCTLMRQRGGELPFTTFTERELADGRFFGFVA